MWLSQLVRGTGIASAIASYEWLVRPAIQPGLGLTPTPLPPPIEGTRRIATWNLRNFGRRSRPGSHDLALLGQRMRQVNADLWCFQEISDPQLLAHTLAEIAGHQPTPDSFWSSRHGGRHHQHLAFWTRHKDRDALVSGREHGQLSMGGSLRPASSIIYSIAQPHGRRVRVRIVNVHLKARPAGARLRREQWRRLQSVLADRQTGAVTRSVLLGDFNVTGSDEQGPSQELDELSGLLASSGYARLDGPMTCSAYWEGRAFDAWKENSRLDLIFVSARNSTLSSSAHAQDPRSLRLKVGGMCRVHACQPFYSSRTRPEPDYDVLSDHCPIFIDLPVF